MQAKQCLKLGLDLTRRQSLAPPGLAPTGEVERLDQGTGMLAQRSAEAGCRRPSLLIVINGHTAAAIARLKRFDPPRHRALGQPLRD